MYNEFPSILTNLLLVCGSSVMFAWAFGNRFARWPAIVFGLVACCIGNLGLYRTAPIYSFATILIAIDEYSGRFKFQRRREWQHSISSNLAVVAMLAMLCSEILMIARDRYFNEIGFAQIYLPGLAGLLLARLDVRCGTRKFDLCVFVGLAAFAAASTLILPERFNDVDMFYFQQNIAPLVFFLANAYFCTFIISYVIVRCFSPALDDSHAGSLANNPMHVSGVKQVL